MTAAADLEIVLAWREHDQCFDLSLAFDDPEDMGDRRLIWHEPIAIDTDELAKLRHDNAAYGATLTRQLFAAEELREFYKRARTRALAREIPLRIRLSIDPDAPAQFGAIRWETLRDLDEDMPVALRTDVRLSRYLSGAGWDTIAPPRKHDLRALVVIANPNDLGELDFDPPLAPIDVPAEIDRARAALGGIETTMLASGGEATLDQIASELDGGIDVLYLVCHGRFVDQEARVFLERSDGSAAAVTATELRDKVGARHHKPTLAVLCACQSAGAGRSTADRGAMAPLGPQLAQAGIAAVVAMQDDFTMETAERFLGRFFTELDRDGIVDRAVAAARSSVADRHDWWVPVLFTRLKRGRTYYAVGFSATGVRVAGFVNAVKRGHCAAVLGPGLAEPVLGSRQALAQKWIERWLLPITEPDVASLTTVGQFVQANASRYTAQEELASYLITERAQDERYSDADRERFRAKPDELIEDVGRRAREADLEEAHAVVTDLGLPVYITTSWTGLLTDALKAAGRDPQVCFFDWNNQLGPQPPVHEPSAEQPLVYHLFGRLDRPETMVLTEDDCFQWLAAWAAQRQEALPGALYEVLIRRSLMFIGYRLEDWDFRVLFQGLRNFKGNDLFRQRTHVGVQVDPTAPGVQPEAAQDYLNQYFQEGGVTIYWGTTKEFLSDLSKRIHEA